MKINSPANQPIAEQLNWWQKYKPLLIFAGFIALLVGLIVVIFALTGANKTLFDWLQLIIVPAALGLIAVFYNRAARRNERGIAYDNQRAEILQSYVNRMVELLFEKNLNDLQHSTRMIILAQTLMVLHSLDPARKECVNQFLHESSLISIIDLSEADLNKSLITPEQLDTARIRKSIFED